MMQLVITPEESGRLDAAAPDPVETLMERAGLGVALAATRLGVGYGSRVVVLAGRGNNGGDGYVAARHLAGRGVSVVVHALGEPKDPHGAAGTAAARARAAGVRIVQLGRPEPADLVIDALFGVGFEGSLPDAVVPWTTSAAPVLAVDVPSGLDAATGTTSGPAFTAVATVTFHAMKPGHLLGEGPERCGPVSIVDIGLDGGEPTLLVCEADDAPRPDRPRTAHKWSAGSVAVVGGAPGITGAPMLTAQAALAMGAGSVALVCPAALQPTYAARTIEVMTRGVGKGPRFAPDDAAAVLDTASRFDVMVLGPGLGDGTQGFVPALLAGWDGPMVLDADGLNALDGVDVLASRAAPTIITPHAGEITRLIGSAKLATVSRLPDDAGVVVVMKGNPTFVLGADRWVITSGGPELATIGTGDVLAGAIAALWSRGLAGEVAARSGAYWHGVAGAALAEEGTVTAERLADAIRRYAWG
jgi:NAD(P)H-hydrate epimerase